MFAHAESFNERDCAEKKEKTGTSYTERNSLCFPFYSEPRRVHYHKPYAVYGTDCIINVMLIVDKDNILPDSSVLEEVIANHPFHKDLVNQLNIVTIKRPSRSDSVHIQTEVPNVTLFIYPFHSVDDQNRYILYHEFGHVADRLNPRFKYSEDVRQALNNRQSENFEELWNLYIDARLNQCNIYRHRSGKFVRKANEPYVEITQETQLLERMDFLTKRGFNNASVIVGDIWNNPMKEYTFIDLVNLVKINMQKV